MSAFTGVWIGLHAQIAFLTENPELAITEADAKEFLLRTQNVMRHYPLTASQKTIDWAAWMFVTSFIYAPRAAAVAKRRNAVPPASQTTEQGYPYYPPPPSPPPPHRANGATPPEFASPPPIPPTVDMDIEPEMEEAA